MRNFDVIVQIRVPAESFAEAERKTHEVMVAAFNNTERNIPLEFMTLSIMKGQKIK